MRFPLSLFPIFFLFLLVQPLHAQVQTELKEDISLLAGEMETLLLLLNINTITLVESSLADHAEQLRALTQANKESLRSQVTTKSIPRIAKRVEKKIGRSLGSKTRRGLRKKKRQAVRMVRKIVNRLNVEEPASSTPPTPPTSIPIPTTPPTNTPTPMPTPVVYRIEFVTPTNGSIVSGEIELVSRVVFAFSHKGYVDYSIDGTSIGINSSGKPHIFLDTRRYPDGEHIVTASAKDSFGRFYQESITIIIQNNGESVTPPSVEFLAPSNMDEASGLLEVNVAAFSPSFIQGVDFFLGNVRIKRMFSGPYRFSFNTRRYENGPYILDGQYRLSARAYDNAGNTTHESIVIVINNVPDNPLQ